MIGTFVATVPDMVVNPHRIELDSYRAMASHLNQWAARRLVSPDAWSEVLAASRDWVEYSGRNQVLLASYDVDGPVAGVETWRLVPSTAPNRSCAVRNGEHGWPVRVPVTTGGNEPDPYLGGSRPTRSVSERWEWRPVFSVDQLARRPPPDALAPKQVPETLTGAGGDDAWVDAVRKVASTTVRGRLPKGPDPQTLLAETARRVSVRSSTAALEQAQLEQAAWLVSDRVGRTAGEMPAWDPEPYKPQDRWQMLANVLDTSRKLTGTLGVVLGEDLTASPLPKMDIVDDRVVPADAVRRLPQATFDRLPIGEWVTVGPYSADEWAARGERGSGSGAYLRLNSSAYLVAVEDGDQAGWRLHDVAERTGHGLLARGTTRTLDEAQHDAYLTVRQRYPALARPEPPGEPEQLTTAGTAGPTVPGATGRWEPMPGEANTSAQQYRLNEQLVLYAFPGPGGQWLPVVQEQGAMTHLPYVRSREAAQEAAELAGRRAARLAGAQSPAMVDRAISEMVASGDYTRTELAQIGDHHLHVVDQQRLAAPDLGPDDLVDLLGAMGATPATTARVLHAEGVDAQQTAQLLPAAGVPVDDGIRLLHDHWDIPRVSAAETLGATATEMRDAGCTSDEILAARPRDVLRTLPDDPRVWELASGAMTSAAHPPARVVSHLVTHAPSPDAFAAGLDAATGDPRQGMALAVRYGAQGDHLAAASEMYGLSPAETATALADAGTAPAVAVETLHHRCDGDTEVIAGLAHKHLGIRPEDSQDHLTSVAAPTPDRPRETVTSLDPTDPDALLRLLPDPGPPTHTDPQALLQLVPDPHPAGIDTPDIGDSP